MVWKENGETPARPLAALQWGLAAFPVGRVGSIKSCQPFARFLLPVQCLAAGPLPPCGSGSGHLPGCAVMLLTGVPAAAWVPWDPIPAAVKAFWDLAHGAWGCPNPFLPRLQLRGAHRSHAQHQQDLRGSPSDRFTGLLEGNFTPAANGHVLTGMQSQTLCFLCSQIALSSRPMAWASSQGDWDTNLHVHGRSGSQLLVRSKAGARETPSIPSLLLSWTQLHRCLLLGMEMGSAPMVQPQLLPP